MSSAVTSNAARVWALGHRDLRIERSYRLRPVMRVVQIAATLTILYYVSKLVVGAPELEPWGGNYFSFAVVGLAVMSVAQLGISTFNQNILREQQLGTLEVLLSTPTPVSVLLAGSFVFPLTLTTLDLVAYLGIGLGLIGDGFSLFGLLWALPIMALLLASFCAFGIAGASLVVLIKRGDPLTAPLTTLTSVLSGALFPVSTFPAAIEAVARAFPAYYGITALREALLTSGGWTELAPDIGVLLAFDVVLLPLSVHAFTRALAAARRAGTLANY